MPRPHVRLALWCEQHGMTAERMKHLAMAVLQDPSNGLARGLMGLVAHDGKWESPDEVSRRTKADAAMSARLAEYNGRRDRLAPTAEAHWKLALWCEQAGLKAEAKAHLADRDPARTRPRGGLEAPGVQEGRRPMGHGGPAHRRADRGQGPEPGQCPLEAAADPVARLAARQGQGQEAGGREGARGGDRAPRRPRGLVGTGGRRRRALQEKAVQVLGQIEAPGSTRALAMLSVLGRSVEVRRAAVTILRRRDPRDYLGVLIGMVRDPLKYEVRPGSATELAGRTVRRGPAIQRQPSIFYRSVHI